MIDWNKKGHAFAVGLVIATLVICSVVLFSFSKPSKSIKEGITPPLALQEIYDSETRFNYYLKEAAKLSEHQAIYETAKKGAVSGLTCKAYGNNEEYVLWDSSCNPSTSNLNDLFRRFFNSSFEAFAAIYPDARLNETPFTAAVESNPPAINRAGIDFENVTLTDDVMGEILPYSIEYSFNPSFLYSFEMGPQEFRNLRIFVNDRIADCKLTFQDAEMIASCLNGYSIQNDWDTAAVSEHYDQKDYLLITLTTKKNFFYQDSEASEFKWQHVKMKFALAV